ncbi:hypothetical protein M378DRAFT_161812 [Amanita muscaria Koide BX008]|uniref:Uncharacterized protein n=1 Tax=Amanita muscaria (strain Koide BX008) TaxID=946122 RepID=A0A0C2SR63_AMAMK|nr:hypothetical protein M378DRAFT_161812 [Amanita muscaria Koide BX008]
MVNFDSRLLSFAVTIPRVLIVLAIAVCTKKERAHRRMDKGTDLADCQASVLRGYSSAIKDNRNG